MERRATLWNVVVVGAAGVAAASALASTPARAAAREGSDLGHLSIEELGQIEITSVSKRPEPLSQAPAAVYVITNDDIRRSGAASLPEALRLAPNLQVARLASATYAITARGFNQPTATANKLQVLVDGRSVYTPLYSGVFWDVQNTPLDDLERIEVISGPAGALWGANAVNGVINVITRPADQTQGWLADIDVGSLDRNATVRYGGRLGEAGAYRVYAMAADRGAALTRTGADGADSWTNTQAGFRADWKAGADTYMIQGAAYTGASEPVAGAVARGQTSGSNLMARWSRRLAGDAALRAQASIDHSERTVSSGIRDRLDMLDLDLQYSVTLAARHALVAGLAYRTSRDNFRPGPRTSFLDPTRRQIDRPAVFIQDEIALRPDLTLTLGFRIGSNSYTGAEYMPNARIAWRPSEQSLLWASIGRAVRIPARLDRDLINPGLVAGGPQFRSETLIAYEAGYRAQPLPGLSLSVSAFYNVYDDLRTAEASSARIFPLVVRNGMEGETYGVESWGAYAVTGWWKLSAGVTTLHKALRLKPGSRDIPGIGLAGNDPDHQATLRSQMNLGRALELDVSLREVAALPNPALPAYTDADARLAWRASRHVELSVSGVNLLHDRHLEFVNGSLTPLYNPRAVQAGVRWMF